MVSNSYLYLVVTYNSREEIAREGSEINWKAFAVNIKIEIN